MVPLYFASVVVRGMPVRNVATLYTARIAGDREFRAKRPSRLAVGVDARWTPESLLDGRDVQGVFGCSVSVRHAEDEVAIRWVHRDTTDEAEVWWHDVVRLRARPEGTGVEHAVARAAPRENRLRPLASSPGILRHLLRTGTAPPGTSDPGHTSVRTVTLEQMQGFVEGVLLDPTRKTPYVVVTKSNARRAPAIAPEILLESISGMACVALVEDQRATFRLRDTLLDRGFSPLFACFDGAVRLYETGLAPADSPYDHVLWLRHRIERIQPRLRDEILAGEIAAKAAPRHLPPRFLRLIEDLDQAGHRSHAEMLVRRPVSPAPAGEESREQLRERDELIEQLRVSITTAREMEHVALEENARLESETRLLQARLSRVEQERDEAQYRTGGADRRTRPSSGITDETVAAFRAALQGAPTPEQSLRVVLALYADRVVVLDSAWKSARRSAQFKHGERAMKLLRLLVTEYWSALGSRVTLGFWCHHRNTKGLDSGIPGSPRKYAMLAPAS